MCCSVGFKPTVTLVGCNRVWWGVCVVEEDMIRSNRKGKMDIYLPYLHAYHSNYYNNSSLISYKLGVIYLYFTGESSEVRRHCNDLPKVPR